MSNREWLNKDLTFAIKHYKELVRKNRFHPVLGNPKKVIRGLRRQRNWLGKMRQWPPKKKVIGEMFIEQDGSFRKLGDVTKIEIDKKMVK